MIGAVCADARTAQAADSSYTFTTFAGVAGTVISSADGTGTAAQFSAPRGVAVDSAGNVYVADSSNNTIRKITAAGVVTTLAGTAGSSGNRDGTGTAALFNEPFGVAVDSAGNVFVADTNNNAIRKITPAGVVTTLAGGSGSGTTDGTGTAAKFHEPHALAIDSAGTIYVADYENHMVRKVTSVGVVTTLAGGADISGYVDGQGTAARFMALQGIAVDSAGNVYVTESGNRDVRKITASGLVTTLASGTGKFGEPRGIAIDASGNFYVGDYGSNVIRKVTSSGTVSLHGGTAPTAGSTDGTTTTALFNGPSGVAIDSASNIYVADTLNNTVRKISSTGAVTTLAGLAGRTSSVDGAATVARFEDPYAVAVDGSGNLYVADATDHSIRKITSGGTVTTLAGLGGSFGSADGTGTAARFKNPLGIAADSAGNVYVADTGNSTLRKITAAGVVTTLAGSAGSGGSTDGTGTAARFMSPYGVTVDANGNIYVVESSAAVRKVTAAGVVTTLAGTSGTNGFTNGTGTAARFSVPFDIAVDGSGNLYVSDHSNHAVRMVSPAGVVTTLAGSGSAGKTDATGSAASFKFPSGLAADSAGNVYLADTDNQVIRKITAAGVVTTIGGNGALGSVDGVGTAATFYNPKDVAVDASGNLYVVDRNNHTIRKGTLAASPTAQTITFGTAPSITAGATGTVSATASSGLSVTFSSTTASTCSVSGSTVTGISAGTCTIAANQAGNSSYAAAAQATQNITISAAATTTPPVTTQSYTLTASMAGSGYGDISSSPSGIACYVPMPGVNYLVAPDCSQSHASGTSVTLTASASSGSRFVGWSGACTGSSASCTVAMSEAKNVTATFANTSTTSDCVFNWAEATYPQIFPAGAYSATAAPYYYRYYAATATYLASSSPDNSLWALGPLTGNSPVNIGPLSTFTTLAGCSSGLSAPGSVALSQVSTQTVGSASFGSSSKLLASWSAPSGYTVDHYEITATESLMNTSVTVSASASATSATLTPLKSSTTYSVVVKACKDSGCSASGSATAVSATTPGEYWQLQGTGNSYTTLSTVVSDGNVLSWVMRWGSDAGAAYAGRYQYYYGSRSLGREGVGVATTSGTGTDAATLTSFSPLTTSGMRRACSEAPGADTSTCARSGAFEISTIQAVPMTDGKIRAFVNAADVLDNSRTRIYSLDSQDGLIGQDFHTGAQAYCGGTGSSDYAPGGACALNLLVDVSSSPSASTPLSQSRQFKIGYDWNADWRWDGAAGTFMVITGDDNCNKYQNALFYATWDGSNWTIARDSNNCAKPIVAAAHGPVLVPLGGVAYKLYYEDQTNGTPSGKPLRLLYGNGRSSGSLATVDFEDWESSTLARQVNFLWPDGSLLDAQDEAGLGDHMILTPTGSLDLQYMFLNKGGFDNSKWNSSSNGLGLAVLLNP